MVSKSRFAILTLFFSTLCYSQNLNSAFQITPYADIHGFIWKEFEDNGAEALKESGPRFSFGVLSRYSFLQKKNLYVELDLQYSLGTVDYQGYTFDLQTGQQSPYTTQTAYWGFNSVTSVGYDAPLSKSFLLTPVGGFEYEVWNRDISNGGPLGYDELYSIIFGNIGVSCTFIPNNHFQMFAGFGIKYPFFISETIDRVPRGQPQKFNIDLSPGSNPRIVAQLGGSVYGVYALFYVETWTLSKSPESQGLHQPESTRMHFGLKLGYTIPIIS